MSKELEALEGIKYVADVLKDNHKIGNRDIANQEIKEMVDRLNYRIPIIKQSLQRLEAIDNANPSEALECLESEKKVMWAYDYDIIKPTLLKAQEQEKVLEIIKNKTVSVFQIKCCKNALEYNDLKFLDKEKLTEEEFDLLKRYFK